MGLWVIAGKLSEDAEPRQIPASSQFLCRAQRPLLHLMTRFTPDSDTMLLTLSSSPQMSANPIQKSSQDL